MWRHLIPILLVGAAVDAAAVLTYAIRKVRRKS